MLLPAVCMISLPYVNSNWSKSPETAKLGGDLCDLDLWPLTLTFCMDITFDHGNNSWKFHDDTMMGTWWKRCDRQTDGRTDRRTDRRTDWTSYIAAWSQLKIQYGCQAAILEVTLLKKIGFSPYTQVICYWSLDLIFKAKLKLKSWN